MKIYQVWDEADPATSDSFYPTLKEARERMKEIDAEQGGLLENGLPDPFHHAARLQVYNLTPVNRKEICYALTNWPNR